MKIIIKKKYGESNFYLYDIKKVKFIDDILVYDMTEIIFNNQTK